MKLIFLDIDGTLTVAGENTPPKSALDAIRRTQAKGNKVFLCTGRNLDMLKPLLVYDFDGVVGSSGGYITVGDTVLYDNPMSDDTRDKALDILHRNGVFCTIEAKDGSWGDDNISDFIKSGPEGNSEIERWRKALAENLGIRKMSEYNGSPIYKIVVMCNDISQLDEAKSALSDEFNFVIQEVKEHNCINGELVNKAFDKGRGIIKVAEYYNLRLEDTIGFGDSMNDLEMIETVGTSVCMDNGANALKEIADVICPRVEDDGLAKAFAELSL